MNAVVQHTPAVPVPATGSRASGRAEHKASGDETYAPFGGILSMIEGDTHATENPEPEIDGDVLTASIGQPLALPPNTSTAIPDLAALVAGATASRMAAEAAGMANPPGNTTLANDTVPARPPAPTPAAPTPPVAAPALHPVNSARTADPDAIATQTGTAGAFPEFDAAAADSAPRIPSGVVASVERPTHHSGLPALSFVASPPPANKQATVLSAADGEAAVKPDIRIAEGEPGAPPHRSGVAHMPAPVTAAASQQMPPPHHLAADETARIVTPAAPPKAVATPAPPQPAENIGEAQPATAPVTSPEPSQTAAQYPQALPPPARQVADAIIPAARDMVAATATQVPAAASPPASAIQTLTVRLEPVDLGTVTVKLALRAGRLDIAIEAADHRTAQLLRTDGEALTKLLGSAGYGVENLAVLATVADRGAPNAPASAQTATPFTGSEGHAQSDRNPQQQRGHPSESGGRREGAAPSHGQDFGAGEARRPAGHGGSRAGAVYL